MLAVDPRLALVLTVGAAALTAALIVMLRPLLVRYALARPNARSSHKVPTPQGGGIAVVGVIAVMLVVAAALGLNTFRQPWTASLLLALFALAAAGVIDDIRPLPVLPRLGLQIAVASLLVLTLSGEISIVPQVPVWLERAVLVIALVWFINLTNFMDGIDGMTVVEVVPIAATLALLGMLGLVDEMTTLAPLILVLLGAMLGFAPFNRHPAKLFLGDVGSLPIGALVGWLLIVLALAGHVAAALILPLYYLADATITLVRRWQRGENIAEAHRSHFYQIALSRGFSVPQVTQHVLVLNVLLAVLAIAAVVTASPVYSLMCVGAAALATSVVLLRFEQGRKP